MVVPQSLQFRCRNDITAHSAPAVAATVLNDCSLVATAGEDLKLNVWNLSKSSSAVCSFPTGTRPEHTARCLAFDNQSSCVAMGSASSALKLFDIEMQKMSVKMDGHRASITALTCHPWTTVFITGSQDCTLRVWDPRARQCVQKYGGHTDAVTAVKMSNTGKIFASGSADHTVKLWDLTAGKMGCDFKGHTACVTAIDFADRPLVFFQLTSFSVKVLNKIRKAIEN